SHPYVEALQIHQHPDDDVLARGGREQLAVEGGFLADVLAEQMAAVDLREQRPGVKRIDDDVFAGARPNEKVPGEVHAFEAESRAAPDLEIDGGQADRNAEPAIEHFIQEAVARVVVVLAIAAESELFVQVRVERRDVRRGARALLPLN